MGQRLMGMDGMGREGMEYMEKYQVNIYKTEQIKSVKSIIFTVHQIGYKLY